MSKPDTEIPTKYFDTPTHEIREEIDYLRQKNKVLEHDLALAREEKRKLELIVRAPVKESSKLREIYRKPGKA